MLIVNKECEQKIVDLIKPRSIEIYSNINIELLTIQCFCTSCIHYILILRNRGKPQYVGSGNMGRKTKGPSKIHMAYTCTA